MNSRRDPQATVVIEQAKRHRRVRKTAARCVLELLGGRPPGNPIGLKEIKQCIERHGNHDHHRKKPDSLDAISKNINHALKKVERRTGISCGLRVRLRERTVVIHKKRRQKRVSYKELCLERVAPPAQLTRVA